MAVSAAGASARLHPLFDRTRCSRLQAEAGVDLILASTRTNVGYLSGYVTHVWNWDYPFAFEMDQDCDRALDFLVFAGIPCDPTIDPFLVTYHHHVPAVSALTWIDDVLGAGRPGFERRASVSSISLEPPERVSHVDRVVSAIEARGLDEARVGVELRRLPVSVFEELRARLPRVRFVDAYDLLQHLRAVKTPAEVERIRTAFAITGEVFRDVFFTRLRPGATLAPVLSEALSLINLRGGTLLFSHFFFGGGHFPGEGDVEPPTYSHPPRRPLEPGTMGSIDFGVAYAGYFSDVNRSVFVGGEPSREQRRVHAAVVEAGDAVRGAVAPGVRARDLFAIGYEVLDRHDLCPALGMLGHGIGMKIHEIPWLQPDSDDVLEPGMVISIEPVVEVPGVAFVSVEDAVVVTEDGCERLCQLSPELRLVG
jgi:Xaa-Pro aminopeptidase